MASERSVIIFWLKKFDDFHDSEESTKPDSSRLRYDLSQTLFWPSAAVLKHHLLLHLAVKQRSGPRAASS